MALGGAAGIGGAGGVTTTTVTPIEFPGAMAAPNALANATDTAIDAEIRSMGGGGLGDAIAGKTTPKASTTSSLWRWPFGASPGIKVAPPHDAASESYR